MKLINRKNFISIVCISFTLLVCGKLISEKLCNFTDRYYTQNILLCLVFSFLITLILSLHFYLQKYPFIPVLIGQYVLTIGITFLTIWVAHFFTDEAPTAYRDMFFSVTVPFVGGAIVYYIAFFAKIKKANKILEDLNNDEE